MNVTACVPYHNEDLEILGRALTSLGAQTVAPHEIIVVDDGSDRPLNIIDVWGLLGEGDIRNAEGSVRVVRVTNRGLPAARNTGLMLAQGEGIVFLDADDWLREDFIEKTVPLFPDHDIVLVGLQEHGPTRNGRYDPGYDRPFDQVTVDLLLNDYNRFFYCALMRVSLMREIGGYHPAMAGWPGVSGGFEDWTTWIDLMKRGARFAAVNEPLLNYNTATPNSMLARAERNREALVAEMRRHHRV